MSGLAGLLATLKREVHFVMETVHVGSCRAASCP